MFFFVYFVYTPLVHTYWPFFAADAFCFIVYSMFVARLCPGAREKQKKRYDNPHFFPEFLYRGITYYSTQSALTTWDIRGSLFSQQNIYCGSSSRFRHWSLGRAPRHALLVKIEESTFPLLCPPAKVDGGRESNSTRHTFC